MALNKIDIACPNCGKKVLLSFSEIKKDMKSGQTITFTCGCRFPPDEVLQVLEHDVIKRWGYNPKLGE